MGFTRRLPFLMAFILAGVLAFPVTSHARDRFGVRGGVYTDISEAFVGAELLLPVGHDIFVNPNIEYVFVQNATYMTFNMDAHVDLPTHGRAYVWLGAGLGAIYFNPDGPASGNTEVGANFLGGVGLKGDVIPYVQAKVIVKDATEFVLAFGLRF
jgi:hypothetical protein